MSNTTEQRTATRTTTFMVEKETKNTVKFEEVPARGQAPLSGSLYVQKHIVEAMAAELGVETLHGLTVTLVAIPAPTTV